MEADLNPEDRYTSAAPGTTCSFGSRYM